MCLCFERTRKPIFAAVLRVHKILLFMVYVVGNSEKTRKLFEDNFSSANAGEKRGKGKREQPCENVEIELLI